MKVVPRLEPLIRLSKRTAFLFAAIFLFSGVSFSQDLKIPEEVLAELVTVQIDSSVYRVAYPKKYNSTKAYPVFLALSGGNQSIQIVDYCYAAWFRSDYFNNHITVMPIAKNGGNLRDYGNKEIDKMINDIKSKFTLKKNHWMIAGTSNGGVAAFNFIASNPKLYSGAIVMPGIPKDGLKIKKSWAHLKFVLAYGELDEKEWVNSVKTTYNNLTGHVQWVKTYKMLSQEHIVSLNYDIDLVYNQYFK